MQRGWLVATCAVACAWACARGGEEGASAAAAGPGSGGEATSGTGASPTVGSSGVGGGGSGGAGGGDLCGNGRLDPREACEGDDFGDKTCASYGLGGGELVCNESCQVVVSGCLPLESCIDGEDDDGDGAIDCDDSDCAAVAACIDSCASPILLTLPAFEQDRSTAGRPSVHATGCGGASGPEQIFQFTAPFNGTLGISVDTIGAFDVALSVRSACGDPGSEIACADRVSAHFLPENLQVPVVQGTVYHLLVDGAAPEQAGWFDLQMFAIGADEAACGDHLDNDLDGLLDCDDPDDCQTLPACASGSAPTGAACAQADACIATGGDPMCLPNAWGFVGGYCSEFCDPSMDDCSGDALCHDLGVSERGLCLDGCITNADCRAGYECLELGLASKVCFTPPESACANFGDDDHDALTDCEDPTGCQGLAVCTPGSGGVGTPCNAHDACASAAGSDPMCIDFWLGGYCTEFCDLVHPDCPSGSVCTPYFGWPSGGGSCLHSCMTSADCPGTTSCIDFGYATPVCVG